MISPKTLAKKLKALKPGQTLEARIGGVWFDVHQDEDDPKWFTFNTSIMAFHDDPMNIPSHKGMDAGEYVGDVWEYYNQKDAGKITRTRVYEMPGETLVQGE